MQAHIGGSMFALSIRDLRKSYADQFEALKGISLDVTQGDFFALLGPNGAGNPRQSVLLAPW